MGRVEDGFMPKRSNQVAPICCLDYICVLCASKLNIGFAMRTAPVLHYILRSRVLYGFLITQDFENEDSVETVRLGTLPPPAELLLWGVSR